MEIYRNRSSTRYPLLGARQESTRCFLTGKGSDTSFAELSLWDAPARQDVQLTGTQTGDAQCLWAGRPPSARVGLGFEGEEIHITLFIAACSKVLQ